MQKFYNKATDLTPEINFDPDNNIFIIKGTSSPEDVRALYYPVIKWIESYVDNIIKGEKHNFSAETPMRFDTELEYFNSSSAKFIYDIFIELKKLPQAGIPVVVQWHHDEEDLDMKDAGEDISILAEMEFRYISINRNG